jgi:hypothetical protein
MDATVYGRIFDLVRRLTVATQAPGFRVPDQGTVLKTRSGGYAG